MSDQDSLASDELVRLRQMIGERPRDSQLRIAAIAGLLRDLVEADRENEVELALTLVVAELADQ